MVSQIRPRQSRPVNLVTAANSGQVASGANGNSDLRWMCLLLGVISLTQVAGMGLVTKAIILVGAAALALGLVATRDISIGNATVPTFWLLSLLALYGVLSISTASLAGMVNAIQIAAAGSYFLYFYHLGRSGLADFRHVAAITVGFATICAVWGRAQALSAHNTISGTVIYLVLLGGVAWLLKSARPALSGCAIFLLVALFSAMLSHRTGVVLGALGMLVFLVHLSFPFRITQLLTAVLVAIIVFVPFAFFVGVGSFDWSYYANLFSEWTGRRATSGRQIIWPVIIDSVSPDKWWGLGTGTEFRDLYPMNVSASSYYLQTYMQTGLVGLAIFLLLLVSLWFAVGRPRRHDHLGAYLSAIVAIVVVHCATETFLMQANLVVGVVAWAALGLGIGAHDAFALNSARTAQLNGNLTEKKLPKGRMSQYARRRGA